MPTSQSLDPHFDYGEGKRMKKFVMFAVLLFVSANSSWAAQQFSVTGMVLKVDQANKSFVVSCQSIPGYMDAMVMPFEVREGKDLDGVAAGMTVNFDLLIEDSSSYAAHIQVRHYESVEQDPLTARRLKLLDQISNPNSAKKLLNIGQAVPDFTLTDQSRHQVKYFEIYWQGCGHQLYLYELRPPQLLFPQHQYFWRAAKAIQRRVRQGIGAAHGHI